MDVRTSWAVAWDFDADWSACRRGRIGRGGDAERRALYPLPRPDYAIALHDDDTLPAGQTRLSRRASSAPPPTFADRHHFRSWRTWRDAAIDRGPYSACRPDNPCVADASYRAKTIRRAPAVITVGSIHGGTKNNIIPDQVELQLSVRTFDPQVRASMCSKRLPASPGEKPPRPVRRAN